MQKGSHCWNDQVQLIAQFLTWSSLQSLKQQNADNEVFQRHK